MEITWMNRVKGAFCIFCAFLFWPNQAFCFGYSERLCESVPGDNHELSRPEVVAVQQCQVGVAKTEERVLYQRPKLVDGVCVQHVMHVPLDKAIGGPLTAVRMMLGRKGCQDALSSDFIYVSGVTPAKFLVVNSSLAKVAESAAWRAMFPGCHEPSGNPVIQYIYGASNDRRPLEGVVYVRLAEPCNPLRVAQVIMELGPLGLKSWRLER